MPGTLVVTITGKASCTKCCVPVTPVGGKPLNFTVTKATTTTQWMVVAGLDNGLYDVSAKCLSTPTPPCSAAPVRVQILGCKFTFLNLTLSCVAAVAPKVLMAKLSPSPKRAAAKKAKPAAKRSAGKR